MGLGRWRQLLWGAAGKFSGLVPDGLCVSAGLCRVCPATVGCTRLHSRLLGETFACLLLDRDCTDLEPDAEFRIGCGIGRDRTRVATTGHSGRDRAGRSFHGAAVLVAGTVQTFSSLQPIGPRPFDVQILEAEAATLTSTSFLSEKL